MQDTGWNGRVRDYCHSGFSRSSSPVAVLRIFCDSDAFLPELLGSPVVLEDFIELLAILKLDSLGAFLHPIEEKLGRRLANRILLRADLDMVGPGRDNPRDESLCCSCNRAGRLGSAPDAACPDEWDALNRNPGDAFVGPVHGSSATGLRAMTRLSFQFLALETAL